MPLTFPLHIFPDNFLDHSLLAPVLLGLCILLLFNEFFGWTLSGYVVPGYLAAVFITFPGSGLVMTVEAVFTYILVFLVSDVLSKTAYWPRFFGRESFFLFVLLSVVVRLITEALLWPSISHTFSELTGIYLRDEFYSIGLVLVPLLANSFWKSGLARGLFEKSTVTGLTYLVLAYVLIPTTNLNLGKFQLTYEDLVVNFLAAPKIYVIIVATAMLASRFNMRYGWDFNGIMVPALISAVFFIPEKVLSTLGEVFLALVAFKLCLRLPGLRSINVGGGRRITLIFFLTFVIKWVTAIFFPELPRMKLNDLFGFGYLLPALLAIKILDKHSVPRVLMPTMLTAAYGFTLGSLLGFVLHTGEEVWNEVSARTLTAANPQHESSPGFLFKDLILSKAFVLTQGFAREQHLRPTVSTRYRRALTRALEMDDGLAICRMIERETRIPGERTLACRHHVDPELGSYLVIHEDLASLMQRSGLGVYLLRPGAPGPVLQVVHPLREPLALEGAYVLLKSTQARAVFIAGIDEPTRGEAWADAAKSGDDLFNLVYSALRGHDVIQVRVPEQERSAWHVRYNLPRNVYLDRLRGDFPNLEFSWHNPEPGLYQWTSSEANFSVLYLPRSTVAEVSPRYKFTGDLKRLAHFETVTGLIERWVLEQKYFIHRAGTGRYVVPQWHELLYFRTELLHRIPSLGPLLGTPRFEEQLRSLQLSAYFLGYQFIWFSDEKNDDTFIILRELRDDEQNKGWGTYVFRLGEAKPWLLIPPRPLAESGTLGLAARWFESFRARALFIPGSSAMADPWGRSDILRENAPRSLAHVVVRHFLQEYGEADDLLVALVRGGQGWRMQSPVVLSLGEEALDENNVPTMGRQLLELIRAEGTQATHYRGSHQDYGLHGESNPIGNLVKNLLPGHFAILWIGDELRRSIMEGSRLERMLLLFRYLRIPEESGYLSSLVEVLNQPGRNPRRAGRGAHLSSLRMLKTYLEDFAVSSNLRALETLLERKVSIRAVVDLRATRIHLVAEDDWARCAVTVGEGAFDLHRLASEFTLKHPVFQDSCVRF